MTVTYGGPATPQVVVLAGTGISAQASCPTNSQQASVNYGHLPLSFEANSGQTDSQGKVPVARPWLWIVSDRRRGDVFHVKKRPWFLSPVPLRPQKPLIRPPGPESGLQRTNDKGRMTKDSYLRMKLVGANIKMLPLPAITNSAWQS